MTEYQFRYRLAHASVAELHRLRRLYPRGQLLELIEEEASGREAEQAAQAYQTYPFHIKTEQMNSIHEAEKELASIFELITQRAPKVTVVGRNEHGRPVVAVGYRGDEMVRAMQIEAYIIERGETIRHRSQLKDGNTILVYEMQRKQEGGQPK